MVLWLLSEVWFLPNTGTDNLCLKIQDMPKTHVHTPPSPFSSRYCAALISASRLDMLLPCAMVCQRLSAEGCIHLDKLKDKAPIKKW